MEAKCRCLQLSSQQTTLCIIGRTWTGKKESARWDDGTMGRRKRRSAFYFSIIAIFIGMPAGTSAKERVPAVFSLSLYKARTPLRGAAIPKSVRLREFTVP